MAHQTLTPRPRGAVVRFAWIFYLPMIATAFLAQEPGAFRIADWLRFAEGMALATAGIVAVVLASRGFSRRTGWGRRLHAEFTSVLGGLDSRQILTLSLLSAFGEEILFRGVVQPWLGLWITTALFGMFHFPARRALIPWSFFAAVLGLALGALVLWSGSLWPAILLHFGINYFNLHDLAQAPDSASLPDSGKPPAGSSAE
jgi:membrane protease YdiL (CAAX protease family)